MTNLAIYLAMNIYFVRKKVAKKKRRELARISTNTTEKKF